MAAKLCWSLGRLDRAEGDPPLARPCPATSPTLRTRKPRPFSRRAPRVKRTTAEWAGSGRGLSRKLGAPATDTGLCARRVECGHQSPESATPPPNSPPVPPQQRIGQASGRLVLGGQWAGQRSLSILALAGVRDPKARGSVRSGPRASGCSPVSATRARVGRGPALVPHASTDSVRAPHPPLRRAMASLGMPLSMDCYEPGPTRPGHNPLPFASLLPGDPALALEQLDVPLGSGIADLPAWINNFFEAKAPDDEFAQFYEVYAALIPNRARVPLEYLEEFKTRAGASPAIWQIEEARACAPEARDVVPPAPAPSPPPPDSQPEPGDSTAEVRVRRRRTLTLTLTLTPDP